MEGQQQGGPHSNCNGDSDTSRGSQDTRMYRNRIYGLKGAAMKMAAQNKSKSRGGEGEDTESPPRPGP